MRRDRMALPSSAWRSSVIDRLFRLNCAKYHESPSTSTPCRRTGSPSPGGSILITSAPMSASSMLQNGPARIRVRSTTRTPESGKGDPPVPASYQSFRRSRIMVRRRHASRGGRMDEGDRLLGTRGPRGAVAGGCVQAGGTPRHGTAQDPRNRRELRRYAVPPRPLLGRAQASGYTGTRGGGGDRGRR